MDTLTADPTVKALERFDDPASWDKIIPNVPIFVPHEMTARGQNGQQKQIKVDEDRLRRIAANINRGLSVYGVPVAVKLGHTKPGTDQKDQPAIVAYGRNARVSTWGPAGKVGLLLDLYYLPGRFAEAREYPFRSAEFYDAEDSITAVALLRTDPKLDMGALIYAAGDGCMLYPADGKTYFYAENLEAINDDSEKKQDGTPAPALMPDDQPLTMRALMQHPVWQYMCSSYQSANPSGMAPSMAGGPPGPGVPPMQQMQKDQAAQHYAKLEADNKIMREALAQQEAKLAALEKQNRLTLYERDLTLLATEERIILDVKDELARCADMTAEQFAVEKNRIARYYQRVPGGMMIPTDGPDTAANGTPYKPPTDDQTERALAYMRQSGKTWDEAIQYVKSGK
jgi:hypothetical protein